MGIRDELEALTDKLRGIRQPDAAQNGAAKRAKALAAAKKPSPKP